jgi:hypothetical protein
MFEINFVNKKRFSYICGNSFTSYGDKRKEGHINCTKSVKVYYPCSENPQFYEHYGDNGNSAHVFVYITFISNIIQMAWAYFYYL